MTDDEFLVVFENCSLPFEQWTHRAHVRAAYLYSSDNDLSAAIDQMRESIKRYNLATNTPEAIDRGYHETMTLAFMRLVFWANLTSGPHTSFQEFCDAHPELLTKSVLRLYYSPERIMTWEAKTTFVTPDLRQLPLSYIPTGMTQSDFEDVLSFWKTTPGVGLSDADNPDGLRDFLVRNPDLSLVVRFEGRIIGAVLCGHDGRRGYLHHLAVESDYRKQGIGQSLVECCLFQLRSQGIQKCNIFVYADNPDGIGFWERNGWFDRNDLKVMQRRTSGNSS